MHRAILVVVLVLAVSPLEVSAQQLRAAGTTFIDALSLEKKGCDFIATLLND